MAHLFRVETNAGEGTLLASLYGEFDIAGVASFEQALALDHQEVAHLVVDLRGLTFIDSSGIRAILVASRRLGEKGASVTVVKAPDLVQRVFELSGVEDELRMVDTPPPVARLDA